MCIYLQNPTLEHYTNYKASELKTTVLALLDLQLNTKGCCLAGVRDKYNQQKVRNLFLLLFFDSFINIFSLVKLCELTKII
jgi:cyclin A